MIVKCCKCGKNFEVNNLNYGKTLLDNGSYLQGMTIKRDKNGNKINGIKNVIVCCKKCYLIWKREYNPLIDRNSDWNTIFFTKFLQNKYSIKQFIFR